MKCDSGIFTLEEYCDYGTVCTSNVRKIAEYKEKKRKKLFEDVDNLKIVRELSERKRRNFFSNVDEMKRKRKVEETEETEKNENMSGEKKRKRKNWITPGMKRTEKTTAEITPELDPNQWDINIALKRNGEGEMRGSTVQHDKNMIQVGKIKNIVKFFENRSEEDIQKPLTYRKGLPANWSSGKEENLGNGQQGADLGEQNKPANTSPL